MAVRADEHELTEADLNAPDLDEGELDVEHYPVPADTDDPDLAAAWAEAMRILETGEEEEVESETVTRAGGITWDEAKHPRGQPGNAGQFGSGGGKTDSAKKAATPKATSAKPKNEKRERIKKVLAEAEIAKVEPLSGGTGANKLVTMDDEEGTVGVFKETYGEKDLRTASLADIQTGTYWRREIAASSLADILGLDDLVPPTVRYQEEMASVQEFVGGCELGAATKFEERFDGDEDLARSAVFDYLIGSMDRHESNWMLKNGKLVLIDNAVSLPNKFHSDFSVNNKMMLEAVSRELPLPDLSSWADKWPEIESKLVELDIESPAIELAKERFETLIEAAGTGDEGVQIADLPGFGLNDTLREYLDDVYTKKENVRVFRKKPKKTELS